MKAISFLNPQLTCMIFIYAQLFIYFGLADLNADGD